MGIKKPHLHDSLAAFIQALEKCVAATTSMKLAVERMQQSCLLMRASAQVITSPADSMIVSERMANRTIFVGKSV